MVHINYAEHISCWIIYHCSKFESPTTGTLSKKNFMGNLEKRDLFFDVHVFVQSLDPLDLSILLHDVQVFDDTQTDRLFRALYHLSDHHVSHVQSPGE